MADGWTPGLPAEPRTCEVRRGAGRPFVAEVRAGGRLLVEVGGRRREMAFLPEECEWRALAPAAPVGPPPQPVLRPQPVRGTPERLELARLVRSSRGRSYAALTAISAKVVHNPEAGRVVWEYVPRCACGRRNGPRSMCVPTDEAHPMRCRKCWEARGERLVEPWPARRAVMTPLAALGV
jgi:hypothetical protein